MVARGIDHIVHAVHDLDAAATLYRSLGFQVGARNRHAPAWGTQNRLVQFRGCFVELLALADTTHIAQHGPRFFSFGAHNRDFLSRGEGLSMLVLESRDAGADADRFRAKGIGDFEVFDFEREGRRPDGSSVTVAFSLAFAGDPLAPHIGFFTCQHRFPENFWNPAFQVHANGATGIAGIVVAAMNPPDHRQFLSAFAGRDTATAVTDGMTVQTPRGELSIATPSGLQKRFGEASPDIAGSARLAALRFTTRDLEAAASALRSSGVPWREYEGKLVAGPKSAMGATLVFEAAQPR